MKNFRSVWILSFLLLVSLFGSSQPVNPVIDSLIKGITAGSYRSYFDSLRTGNHCSRKVMETDRQSSDHDACRDYVFRKFQEYLGQGNVFLDEFCVDNSSGLANIIAFKKGRSLSTIVISAHYDTNNSNEENVFVPLCAPGANDNGTGLAAVLEIARVLAGIETEYSVLFAVWDYEERFTDGFGSGSNYWFSNHVVRKKNQKALDYVSGEKLHLNQIAANLNFDMFGHPNDTLQGKLVLWACTGDVRHSGFVDEYISAINRYVPEIAVANFGKMAYSDHFTFAARKIPAIENLESNYDIDPFYHTCFDNFENPENVDFGFAASVTKGGLAFLLEKTGVVSGKGSDIVFPTVNVSVENKFYSIQVPRNGSVSVYAPMGNSIRTRRKGGLCYFRAPSSGLYRVTVHSDTGSVTKDVYLQKKGDLFASLRSLFF
ncbi:MAG TPA: M28 family peptidase [Prolixibacteraceae bacterium]|nr:M28 family peptidase [Prolixibacteraceae bacterium]